MGVGEAGRAGACVLLLVEGVKRLENGCATTQSLLTVGAPVQETPLRYPGAIHRLAQVSNSDLGRTMAGTFTAFLQIKKGCHSEPINYKTVPSLGGRIREKSTSLL